MKRVLEYYNSEKDRFYSSTLLYHRFNYNFVLKTVGSNKNK